MKAINYLRFHMTDEKGNEKVVHHTSTPESRPQEAMATIKDRYPNHTVHEVYASDNGSTWEPLSEEQRSHTGLMGQKGH